ncbi:unnamed protein product [Adineta ricciae]|uniref:Uncharacterized protein n=1 Tax=Adineta ricciae TaxID=249248 RepID=A0A815BDT6_ADIRI|nr:unnamed protein product [Adineta ricciae]CAF1417701.1 unnamed protein product [Adineta ricciae]
MMPTLDEDFEKDGYLKEHGTSEDLNKVRNDQGTERKVPQSFTEASTSGDDKRKTLMIFRFPKRTEQAVNLGKIFDKSIIFRQTNRHELKF